MGDILTEEILQQWSYDTKLNDCSNDKHHTPECNGNCGRHKATVGQVDLHNEVAIWTSQNKPIVGLPSVIAGQIPISGFPVEILNVEKKLTFLLQFLVEKNIVDEQEFLEYYRLEFAKFLKEARLQTESEQARASIVIPHIGLAKNDGPIQH